MTPESKAWIDNASYRDLLRRWRFSEAGDEIFQGDTGKYFAKVMAERRAKIGPVAHTAASKSIGWDR